MDPSAVLFTLFGLTSIGYILHLGFYLVGASLYDIGQHRRRMHQATRSEKRQAKITILVPAHNEEKVIVRCLDSIRKSSYRNREIIVVNDASTDTTRRILDQYKRSHPTLKLRVIHKRRNGGKGSALNYALKRYVTTELVMMLDADSLLSPDAVSRAVSYFNDPTIAGVAANVQIINEHTTLSILQKFEHMIGYRSKKAYSLTNCEFVIGGVASTYRTNAIRAVGFYDTDTLTEDISLSMKIVATGNKQHRLVYAADVMAMTEPVETFSSLLRQRYRWKYGSLQNIFKHTDLIGKNDAQFSSMLTIYRMPMAVVSEGVVLLLPCIWGYAIYLTLVEKNFVLLLGAYLTVTVYMFMTLWFDEHMRRVERLYLTLYVPLAYFIFYIMDIIQIISVTRCLIKMKNLSRRKNIGATWSSPQRIGGSVSISGLAEVDNRVKA